MQEVRGGEVEILVGGSLSIHSHSKFLSLRDRQAHRNNAGGAWQDVECGGKVEKFTPIEHSDSD